MPRASRPTAGSRLSSLASGDVLMNRRACLALLILPAFAWTQVPAKDGPEPARKAPPAVIDGAGLFSAPTKKQAQEIVDTIHKEFGIDVCLETVKEVPGLGNHGKLAKQREALHKQAQDNADNHD